MKKITISIFFCLFLAVIYFVSGNLTFQSDSNNRIKGIDVSNTFQGELNWDALRENKGFVILRAVREVDTCKTVGVQKFASLIDPNFLKNWNSLKQHQIIKGAYHFFAKNVSAEEQFKTYRETVKLEKGDLPPILDVEDRNCDIDEAFKWLELAEEYYGMTPILYSDYFFYKVFLKKKNNTYPIWLYLNASSNMEPSFNDPNCLFWQYQQDKKINNFQEAKVDFNVFLGDSSEMHRLLKH
jgi:lysozyme